VAAAVLAILVLLVNLVDRVLAEQETLLALHKQAAQAT
jgi:hypothetical protein